MEKYFMYGGAGLMLLLILVAVFTVILIRRRSRRQEEQQADYWQRENEWLANAFDNFDVAVYGLRGSGKDVIFAHCINLHGRKHYSNIWYNPQTEVRDLKDLNVGGNQYPDFINGTLKRFTPNFVEGAHFFISDAGVYLGCQYNRELNQNYGEMPIHIALRRHLYDSHVHTNSQALNRPWDKIREQQGCFIHALGTKNYGDCLIVSAISYTKYESALECMPPPEKPDEYHVMKHGEIRIHKFKVPVKSLSYDTRHFKNELFFYAQEVFTEHGRAKIIIRPAIPPTSETTIKTIAEKL
ncbi:MAG: hypothetical protein FWD58_11050 [Firmicutes bacterium]|nr:hypothetical protein [Bacillota bacterium]